MCILVNKYLIMTTATQNEEDLIIIGDETSADTSILDFNFSQPQENQVSSKEETDFIIDFSDEEKNEVSTDFTLDTQNITQESSEVISFWEDLFLPSETQSVASQETIETPENREIIENTLSFSEEMNQTSSVISDVSNEDISFEVAQTPENHTEVLKSETHFDRNTILDEAIIKMQSRKWTISEVKHQRQTNVNLLTQQITKLQEQVAELEREIKDLEKEDSALDLDIASIEKMKSSILDITTDRPRKHNLSTIKK